MIFGEIPIFTITTIIGLIASMGLAVFSIIMLGYSILIINLYKRFVTTKIILTDDVFIFSNNKRKIQIAYNEILLINSKFIRNTGGWLLIETASEKPIRLTVVVENIGDLIITLKERMDYHGLHERYDKAKLFQFFKTSCYADESWVRSRYYIPKFFLTLLIHSILTIIIASTKNDGETFTALIPLISMIIGMMPYLYIELGIYGKRYKTLPETEVWTVLPHDIDLAKKRMNACYLIYVVLAVSSLIIEYLIY